MDTMSNATDSRTASEALPEPIHHPDCRRLSASGEFIFPDTRCTCGGYRSLEEYFASDYARGVIDHMVRANVDAKGAVTFYIHPSGKDGDTLDFEVQRNHLRPDPKLKRIVAEAPVSSVLPRSEKEDRCGGCAQLRGARIHADHHAFIEKQEPALTRTGDDPDAGMLCDCRTKQWGVPLPPPRAGA